jgi:hypothetical protein
MPIRSFPVMTPDESTPPCRDSSWNADASYHPTRNFHLSDPSFAFTHVNMEISRWRDIIPAL